MFFLDFRLSPNKEVPKVDAQGESAQESIQPLQIIMSCRKILDGEVQKTLALHRQLITLLTSEEQLNFIQQNIGDKAFLDVIWAVTAVALEPPHDTLDQELEQVLNHLAGNLSNIYICLDYFNRCQYYDLDAGAFIAHAAPKLMRRVQSEDALRATAFRCLIGMRDRSTYAFMRSWIKEYGLAHPITQELISIAPRIARLIYLTYAISNTNAIQQTAIIHDGHQLIPLIPPPEVIDRVVSLSNEEDPQIKEAWSTLQCGFVESCLLQVSIIDAFEWIPEILIQPLQQRPRWLQNDFNWDFLAAVLIPVLEVQSDSKIGRDLVISLCEQVLFALLHQREVVYIDYKLAQREDGYSSVDTRLYPGQSQLLYATVESSPTEIAARIDLLLYVLKTVGLVDCIVLGHVVDNRRYSTVESSSSDVVDNSFKNHMVCAVGEYLFDIRNQQVSERRVLGSVRDVWEKLIDLLSQRSPENVENAIHADQWFMEFFRRFHNALLPNWWLRRKLYRVGKSTKYRQFRRILFTTLMQHQELLPNSRSEDSKLLVQVLAELWDSDCTWVADRQSRLDSLRVLLGQLQEIDAVGARRLADQIADSLAHQSN